MAMRKRILGVASLAFAMALSTGVAVSASAQDSVNWSTDFKISATAVRTEDPSGLRFWVDCPVDYSEDGTVNAYTVLKLTTSENKTYTKKVHAQVWRSAGDGWNTALTHFPEAEYATEVTAQAFVVIDENTTYETAPVTTSIAETAAKAISLGNTNATVAQYVEGVINSISVAETAELGIGETTKLTATIDPANYAVLWTSDNEAVATVSADGTVTAKGPGTANITASMGGVSDTCAVTVSLAEWATEYGITGANIKSVSEEGVTFEKGVTGRGQAGKPANADGYLGYLTYNGSYGAGDYVVVDFTGDNMPMIKFFGQTATDDVVNVTGTKTTAEQGVVLLNAYRDETGDPAAAFKNNDLWLLAAHGVSNIGLNDKQSNSAGNYRNVGFDTSTEKYNAVALAARPDTSYRMIFGFEKFDTTGATVNFAIYNLDNYTLEWERTFNTGTMYSSDDYANYTYSGLIQLFGHYGKEITLDKVHPIYEDTNIAAVKEAVKPVAPDYLSEWMTANNVTGSNIASSTQDLGLTFAAGDTARGQAGKAANEDSWLGYINYAGDYGQGDYVVVDFTGDNMPMIKFFSHTVDDDLVNDTGNTTVAEQGVVFLNGYRDSTGVAANAFKNDSVYVLAGHGIRNIGFSDKQSNGGNYRNVGFDTSTNGYSMTALANSTTKYRMIVGFNTAGGDNGLTLGIDFAIINLDTGAVEWQRSFNTSITTVQETYVWTGNIQIFGHYGKAITLDKVYAIEEDTTLADLLTKYTPAA